MRIVTKILQVYNARIIPDAPGQPLKYVIIPMPNHLFKAGSLKVIACGACRTDLHKLWKACEKGRYIGQLHNHLLNSKCYNI